MSEFWLGVSWGVGGVVIVSAVALALLVWRTGVPVIEEDEHGLVD